jgi:rhodanese-related sulfurtransferase
VNAPDVSATELRARLAGGEPLYVLDVREPEEVSGWAFPGAINIPLGQLGDRVGELPDDREIVVICHSGIRSAAAANALEQAGWPAANLAGGVVAWVASEPPDMEGCRP